MNVTDSWSLTPIGEVRLGERVFPVPPLTLGRFQRLLAFPHHEAMQELLGHDPRGFAPVVAAIVPGVTEELWRENASSLTVMHLFAMFAEAHDWKFISDAIRFGEPVEGSEKLPTPTDIVAGLLAVAKGSGHTVEALTEMRLDGFYLIVEALREGRRSEEPGEGAMPPGFEAVEGDPTGLVARLQAAEDVTYGRAKYGD